MDQTRIFTACYRIIDNSTLIKRFCKAGVYGGKEMKLDCRITMVAGLALDRFADITGACYNLAAMIYMDFFAQRILGFRSIGFDLVRGPRNAPAAG